VFHGFVRANNGAITSFDPPGSLGTIAKSINPDGVITGDYLDGGVARGFVRSP